MCKKITGFFYRHIQHVVNIFPFIADFKRLLVKPFSTANVTLNIHIRKKIHLDRDNPRTLTVFTTAAFHVKAESSGLIAADLRFGKRCKKITYTGKNTYIRSRIGTGGSSDRTLIYVDDLVDMFKPRQFSVSSDSIACPHQMIAHRRIQNIAQQRRLSGTGNPGYTGKSSKRNTYRNIFQIVLGDTAQDKEITIAFSAFRGNLHAERTGKVLSGQTVFLFHNLFRRTGCHDISAVDARSGSQIDDPVSCTQRLFVMFDNDDAVSQITKIGKRVDKTLIITLMQTDRWFVKNIHDTDEA